MLITTNDQLVRPALLGRIETLRRERGAALLDSKKFDHAALAAAERDLEALSDVENEAARRASEALAKAAAERRAQVAAVVASHDQARMAALAAAEQAARELVKSLLSYREECDAIVSAMRPLGPSVPGSLLPQQVARRMGAFIAGSLFPIRSDTYSVGDLEWHQPLAPLDDWPAADRAMTAADLEATLNQRSPQ